MEHLIDNLENWLKRIKREEMAHSTDQDKTRRKDIGLSVLTNGINANMLQNKARLVSTVKEIIGVICVKLMKL